MTRLLWNTIGERLFEAGVDRGVLYLEGLEGVPWNGLVSVSETPLGGEITPYYIDGIKYHNRPAAEEFQAVIEAYTYPDEFSRCEGTVSVNNGLFVTQQKKSSFGMAYRTMVGNDVAGVNYAYKIHLVYNAMTASSERENNTIGELVEPGNFSWTIVSKPPIFTGHSPTSHFVIDSRETPADLLDRIEQILYGSSEAPPRLPSVLELVFMFKAHQASIFDAGFLTDYYMATIDSGVIPELQTSTIDGGGVEQETLSPSSIEYDGGDSDSTDTTSFDGGDSDSSDTTTFDGGVA